MVMGTSDKGGDRTRKEGEILYLAGGTFSADCNRYQRKLK